MRRHWRQEQRERFVAHQLPEASASSAAASTCWMTSGPTNAVSSAMPSGKAPCRKARGPAMPSRETAAYSITRFCLQDG
jgi:hypothetical protein